MATATTLLTSPPFFREMWRYSCVCLSNFLIINGLPRETLGIEVISLDVRTLFREDSYLLWNHRTVLSPTLWVDANFWVAREFPYIDAFLPIISLSLSENWVYFWFFGRLFNVSVTLLWSITPSEISSTLGKVTSSIKCKH